MFTTAPSFRNRFEDLRQRSFIRLLSRLEGFLVPEAHLATVERFTTIERAREAYEPYES